MLKSPKHLKFIRGLPCLSCGRIPPSEAAHIRFGSGNNKGGMGMKPSDNRTVPLCDQCHTKQHQIGETVFWERLGIKEPVKDFADKFFAVSKDQNAARKIIFDRLLLYPPASFMMRRVKNDQNETNPDDSLNSEQ